MSDQAPAPEKGAGNPPEKGGDDAAKAPKGFYTQAQVDDIVNEKTKREVARVNSEKDAEIEKFRQAAMTEDEKKLEAARKDGGKEEAARRMAVERKLDLTHALLEGGANQARIRHLHALAAEFADPKAELKDVVALLKKEAPEHFQGANNFGPGDGVTKPNSDADEIDFSDPEAVQAKSRSFKTQAERDAWHLKNRDKINQNQFRGGSIVRRLPQMGTPIGKT